METEWARARYKKRKQLVEPVFGILKEQQGAGRFLPRGMSNVRAEWSLLATAFNLRMLQRFYTSGRARSPGAVAAAAAA